MYQQDTIIALATPAGRGGIGILRVSGSLVISVANALLGQVPQPRQAKYLSFYDDNGVVLDQGIVLFFPGPASFTGEDVLELHGHGGPVILDLLMKRILALPGIRIARPGEFSERAFLNDKLDLAQAEAIADLINASSVHAARLAVNSMQGTFSKYIYVLVELLTNLRIDIEAAINFPDEEIILLSKANIKTRLNNIISSLEQIYIEARQGSILREGLKIVIAGKPNVGKSSLLNALAGRSAAIVTDIEGTTRDVLCEHIFLDGIPLYIIDTAGLCDSNNIVERIGIERAWNEIKHADHILFMVDGTVSFCINQDLLWLDFINRLPPMIPITILINKIDLIDNKIIFGKINGYSSISISAYTGAGIDLLRNYLKQEIGFTTSTEGRFLARRRHLNALETTASYLQQGKEQFLNFSSWELLAEDLRLAQQSLDEITGNFSSDELLKKIFSNFCVGK